MKILDKEPIQDIPKDAQFLIGKALAKVEKNLLYLYINNRWTCQNKSLKDYNTHVIFDENEYTLFEIMLNEVYRKYNSFSRHKRESFYIYIDKDGEYRVTTFYEPVIKGYISHDGSKKPIYKGGESILLDKNKYPQLKDLAINGYIKVDIGDRKLLLDSPARKLANLILST